MTSAPNSRKGGLLLPDYRFAACIPTELSLTLADLAGHTQQADSSSFSQPPGRH